MDRKFARRKRDLERECQVYHQIFSTAAKRLERFLKPFLASYRRHEQAAYATTVVRGLCSDLQHKNGESIAYLFGLDRKAIQHFLGELDGVIAFDPSAFAKSGDQSVGMARQWCD